MEKYEFAKPKIKLLGHQISAERMIPNPGKIIAIEALEWLITILKFRGFLKAIGFFKKYIQGFKQIAKLLNDMTLAKFKNC